MADPISSKHSVCSLKPNHIKLFDEILLQGRTSTMKLLSKFIVKKNFVSGTILMMYYIAPTNQVNATWKTGYVMSKTTVMMVVMKVVAQTSQHPAQS